MKLSCGVIALYSIALLVGHASAQSTTSAGSPSPTGLVGNTKTWSIPDAVIPRGDAQDAVRIKNATFTLLYTEQKQGFLLDFNRTNLCHADFVIEDLLVVGHDNKGNEYPLTKVTYYSIMQHCYYGDAPSQQSGRLNDSQLINILMDVQFKTPPISGKIGKC